jgi:hypothetical protein
MVIFHGYVTNNQMVFSIDYPLVICYSLLLKMAIEIVDLPINSMVMFHSYVNVYQMVKEDTKKCVATKRLHDI